MGINTELAKAGTAGDIGNPEPGRRMSGRFSLAAQTTPRVLMLVTSAGPDVGSTEVPKTALTAGRLSRTSLPGLRKRQAGSTRRECDAPWQKL